MAHWRMRARPIFVRVQVAACGAAVVIAASKGRADAQVATPDVASAASTRQVPSASPPTTTGRWYGYQLLALDAASVTLMAVGGGSSSGGTAVAALGVMLWAASGPIVHGLHHQPSKSAGSFGLRLGCPLVGALAGAGIASVAIHPTEPRNTAVLPPALAGAIVGFLVGAAGGVVVDDFVLARDGIADDPKPRATPAKSSFFLAPDIVVAPQGERGARAGIGVAGMF